jgi:uroporphyrinogen III methyltransferase/synthase
MNDPGFDPQNKAAAPCGKVWLVGAGPGDPGLLTLNAKAILESAGVVIHDRLVSEDLLLGLPPGIRLVDVGKSSGDHPVPQDEINRILIAEARAGKKTVRLKGGDPFIFGRGGEEIQALEEAGISWEVIPGLSSALAVPALAGIPLTHRDYSSSVHIITWRKRDGASPGAELLRALAQTGGALVILMGGSALGEIREKLLASGFAPETPAAVIENGSARNQQVRRLPLGDLKNASAEPVPVLVVLGAVCGIGASGKTAETAAGFAGKNPPLAGLRIVATRPEPKNAEACKRIRELGGKAIPFPCIKIFPSRELKPEQFRKAGRAGWIVFTSSSGVGIFFESCLAAGIDFRAFGSCRFAVIGPATAGALTRCGFIPDYMPQEYNSASLARGLAEKIRTELNGNPGGVVLLARSSQASPELPRILKEQGISFTELTLYDVLPAEGNAYARKQIEAGNFDLVFLSSPFIAGAFAAAFPDLDLSRLKAVCIGRSTACRAGELGMTTLIADEAAFEGMCRKAAEICASICRASSP